MKIQEKLRNIIFWTVDLVKGGHVKRHYRDIVHLTENIDREAVRNQQELYVSKLLTHASKTTIFYAGFDPEKIANFPVINKEIIKVKYQQFQSRVYKNKKKFSVATSGSTGASFQVFQDLNKKARNTADILYYSDLAGFKLGYKLFYLRFWSMFEQKNKLQSFIQNVRPIDVFDLSSVTIKNIIEALQKDTSNKGMLGYASSFDKICSYLETVGATKIHCNLKSVIGISERLDPTTKIAMKKYFGVDMISRYSNAENGMIAQQPLGKDYFSINTASYYVEILNFEDDNKCNQGELGRIVITDLFNFNTPIIRYDTGDIGVMEYKDDIGRLVLTKVEGRKMDMIRNTAGEILSTSILLVINKYEEVEQRQIIQKTPKKYLFKLKIKNNIFEKEKEFIQEFIEYLGDDAIINIEYVSEIPLLASGKQRAIVDEVVYR